LIAATHENRVALQVSWANLDAQRHTALHMLPLLLAATHLACIELDLQRFSNVMHELQIAF
jgi:hypothetical protein